MKKKIVYIVHSIDTEGPLYESLEAKFQRIKELFNVKVKCSKTNLNKLKLKKISLKGKENKIASVLSNHLTNYNSDWKKIDEMVSRIFSKKFRQKYKDSFGNSWIFNWHCLDHAGYKINPRRRALGYHKIFDYYQKVLKKNKNHSDKIHWHFHPMSTYKEAHRCATSYVNSPELYQILCRKILERNFFPSVYRAGFHVERPDSNLFLEQWIPFDLSNISTENTGDLDTSQDTKLGRLGDWRNAPKNWDIYHPSHDDYRTQGNCRRWIGRALTVMNRAASINQKEMDKAFIQAKKKGFALVGLTGHDFRDLEVEVEHIYNLIKQSKKKFKKIDFQFTDAKNAFVQVAKRKEKVNLKPLKFKLKFFKRTKKDYARIQIIVTQGQVFGPQPFLAIKTKNGRFIHDNLDFTSGKKIWNYAFYENTIPIEDVLLVGVAANDRLGNTFIKKFKIQKNLIKLI